MFQVDRSKQKFFLDGAEYDKDGVLQYLQDPRSASDSDFRRSLFQFLQEWFDDSETLEVRTSGSTGPPKVMRIEKRRMMQSACLTCSFLGLKPRDTALLCMSLEHIGAKMLVTRALVLGLNLFAVKPSSRPLEGVSREIAFAAMTPNQVARSLENEEDSFWLSQVRHLIIGGASVDASLESRLSEFPRAVWSTYGMTETLSHIALRRISGSERSDWYKPFEGVQTVLSEQGTLIIEAPAICSEPVVTNDLAEINSRGWFRILGRADNVVVSGGVKIQVEEVEALFQKYLRQPFAVTSVPHPELGESLVLLVEGSLLTSLEHCKSELPNYWYPKQIVEVGEVPRTANGKIDRVLAKEIARSFSVSV